MSPIIELIKACEAERKISSEPWWEVDRLANKALPDLRKLWVYIESAQHGGGCVNWNRVAGSSECTCGLSGMRKLLGCE